MSRPRTTQSKVYKLLYLVLSCFTAKMGLEIGASIWRLFAVHSCSMGHFSYVTIQYQHTDEKNVLKIQSKQTPFDWKSFPL